MRNLRGAGKMAVAVVAGVVALAGCSGADGASQPQAFAQDTPRGVVEAYYKAVVGGDLDGACTLLGSALAQAFTQASGSCPAGLSEKYPEKSRGIILTTFDEAWVSSETDASMVVNADHPTDGAWNTDFIELAREGENWFVSSTAQTWSGSYAGD